MMVLSIRVPNDDVLVEAGWRAIAKKPNGDLV
jgi:hypothetical protein